MVLPCFSCVTGVRCRLAGNACGPYRPIGSARPVHSQIDAVMTRFRWKPSPVITVVEGFTIARLPVHSRSGRGVPPARFERATNCLEGSCSIH